VIRLRPRHWSNFQHYKDRNPPWIKLHRSLLNDRAFMLLATASKALAPLLWLLAAESVDGTIEADAAELAFRLRMTEKEVNSALDPLLRSGFFEDASGVLATCLQPAISETETETDRIAVPPRARPPVADDEGFPDFWAAYGKKVDKPVALRAWRRLKPDTALRAAILAAATADAASTDEKQFRKNPATWLNARGWENEIIQRNGHSIGHRNGRSIPATHIQNLPLGNAACLCAECERFRSRRTEVTA
jgi:hypothetical protein